MRLTDQEFTALTQRDTKKQPTGRLEEKKAVRNDPAKPKGVKRHEDHPAIQTSDMESASRNESLAKKKSARYDKGCHIHLHSRTKRLADPDGRSIKACIDGLVAAGILPDDSAKFVKKITQSQELTKGDEETIIEVCEFADEYLK